MSGGLGSPLPSWWFDPVELICRDKLEAIGSHVSRTVLTAPQRAVRWSKRLAALVLLTTEDG